MRTRTAAIGTLSGLAAVLLAASVALADTCCANTALKLHPTTANLGETVTVGGIVCLGPDNSGPLPLNLDGFWLSTDHVPADADPGSVPGGGGRLANDLPGVETWLPFASVTGGGAAAAGTVTLVVPAVTSGSYQLWWHCENGAGPGSGIHYSGGSRLRVQATGPNTATGLTPLPGAPAGILLLAASIATAVVAQIWRRGRAVRRRHAHDAERDARP
jgi:hypothetical protein